MKHLLIGCIALCTLALVGVTHAQNTTGPLLPDEIKNHAHCHTLNSSFRVPQGFGAAYDVTTRTKDVIMRAFCEEDKAEVVIGERSNVMYVYKTGYYWDAPEEEWRSFSLRGPDRVSSWFRGYGKATIDKTVAEMEDDNYVLGYTCKWNGAEWKCGCRDSACDKQFWQLQIYQYEETVPPVATGTPPAIIIDVSSRKITQGEDFKITYKNAGSEPVEYSPQFWCLVAYQYRDGGVWMDYNNPIKIAAPCSLEKLGAGEDVTVTQAIPDSAPTGAWRVVFRVDDVEFYSDVFRVSEDPNANPCVIAGCSSQVCVHKDRSDIITTCEYLPEYACYRTAACEPQADGVCGWTLDNDLKMCLDDPNDYFSRNSSNVAAAQSVMKASGQSSTR